MKLGPRQYCNNSFELLKDATKKQKITAFLNAAIVMLMIFMPFAFVVGEFIAQWLGVKVVIMIMMVISAILLYFFIALSQSLYVIFLDTLISDEKRISFKKSLLGFLCDFEYAIILIVFLVFFFVLLFKFL